ncbi:DUF4393 domain-containing protein [Psychrobacillus sp. INOP01]|uniref:DUF4393 domain-containing protein n=1 Tax=Psychrobacillus sp. INOP01 TaxID=2829187 RepID=UPI001BA4D70A|nr:DUF4393 domain-containing protein [Psychrobacillus sp. INOP01]QUG41291.1 DUF4393 domain-containing protein [Psychrobacillus sp. INOP01]
MKDILGLGKLSANSLEVINLVYPDVAQPGLKKVGQSLETVLELCNTILLPLKLVNSNANVFFNHHMEKYRKKMEDIPEEELTVVHPSIGLKILDELLTVTNEDVSDLFVNLLTSASTKSGAKYAHPSFVEVIKNLGEDEAKIIIDIFHKEKIVKYVYLMKEDPQHGDVPLKDKINDISKLTSLIFEENSQFYMENLMKLGIIEDTSVYMLGEEDEFNSLEVLLKDNKEIYDNLIKQAQDKGEHKNLYISYRWGRYILNSYGESFVNSVTSKITNDSKTT